MNYEQLFLKVSLRCSRVTAKSYSTSFSLGIRCLEKEFRDPIYAIYGFVRFADEIVDTFHGFDQLTLFTRFREDTHRAIAEGISLNPILHSFQDAARKYNIEPELYETFLKSMEMDLIRTKYDATSFKAYILGSAEVVGLMCLRVFTKRDEVMYQKLKPTAMSLGAAFQKVNFLRDLKADYYDLGRSYFPDLEPGRLTASDKQQIIENIEADFKAGYRGIQQLPRSVRFAMYVVYVYYSTLFRKLKRTPADRLMSQRIRIPNRHKISILAYSYIKHQLNLI